MRIETCFVRRDLDGPARAATERIGLHRGALLDSVDVILSSRPIPPGIAAEIFADPVIQHIAASPAPTLPVFAGWDWLVEISFRPGVTDTLALTSREALSMCGVELAPGDLLQTARLYIVRASGLSRGSVTDAFSVLWNPLIQSAVFISRAEWAEGKSLPELYPEVSLHESHEPELFDLASFSDRELEELSRRRLLALSLEELQALREHYRDPRTLEFRAAAALPREATDVEIEMVAQTWSEHCKHKIFNAAID
ncbi:MAG TPA: hypothetical protein VMC79_06260, partial [Rectinemataceae bacterium]|nr:hypothetical protein [Rectinemataceae bacterium]